VRCRLITGSVGTRPKSLAAWEVHNHSHLFKSALLPGCPGIGLQLGYRLLLLAVFVVGVVYQGASDEKVYDPAFFKVFTNWTWLLFGLYSLVAVVESVRGLREVSTEGGFTRPFDSLDKFFSVLTATVPGSCLFLSAFYWAALYERGKPVRPLFLVSIVVASCMC
jgi:hypothetical protein